MENGFFITLQDEQSLALYLREGVFSQHQRTQMDDDIHHSSNHYDVLADYACAREDTHVFFFRDRKIYYGGRVTSGTSDEDLGAFWINGDTSPMGRRSDAGLGWDETVRDDFEAGDHDGVFLQSGRDGKREMCQPFLLRFNNDVENAGNYIRSDDLYFELGNYPFPLQSNTIRNAGFAPMGPGETQKLLEQIERSDQTYVSEEESVDIPDVELDEDAIEPFKPEYRISEVKRANLTNEAHLEASVTADPSLLPEELQPRENESIVRQAPISPLKPMQIDAVDLCFYHPEFEQGMYPRAVLELKYTEPNNPGQIQRYRESIDKMATHHLGVEPDDVSVMMYSPSYGGDFDSLDQSIISRVTFRQFEDSPEIPGFVTEKDSY